MQTDTSAPRVFINNIVPNSVMAFMTVPTEGLAVRRITHLLQHPSLPPPSYSSEKDPKVLFQGSKARVMYCLAGNFATIAGIDHYGKTWEGMWKTAAWKALIYPLSLWSNVAQTANPNDGLARRIVLQTFNPSKQGSFFLRNFLSNVGLYPGLWLRDRCFSATDSVAISNGAGFSATVVLNGLINTVLKPIFTEGKFPLSSRLKLALSLPALSIITIRESVSAFFSFSSTPCEKA